MNDGIPTPVTTSAGMPPLATVHDALLDQSRGSEGASRPRSGAFKAQSLVDEGKAQVSGVLDGVAEAVHQFADQLDTGPGKVVSGYARQAAGLVAGWSATLDAKSLEEIGDDVRAIVRSRPALAVGVAVAAGFVLSRVARIDGDRL